jgi:hypothetical protein
LSIRTQEQRAPQATVTVPHRQRTTDRKKQLSPGQPEGKSAGPRSTTGELVKAVKATQPSQSAKSDDTAGELVKSVEPAKPKSSDVISVEPVKLLEPAKTVEVEQSAIPSGAVKDTTNKGQRSYD